MSTPELHLHLIPCVGNVSIAGQHIARLLVEAIAHVRILAGAQTAALYVARFVKVIPGQAALVGGHCRLHGVRVRRLDRRLPLGLLLLLLRV